MKPTKHLLTGLFLEHYMFIFEGKVEDIHAAHYKDVPEETFRQIVLADPTTLTDPQGLPKKMGNYCKWLLGLFKQGNLPLEDLQKAKNSLTVFAKALRQLPVEQRDVNKFKSLPDLFDAVAPYEGNKTKGEEAREIKQEGAEKLYDDGQWIVMWLKTPVAATYYGKGTKWCTTAENGSQFDNYNAKGKIYVNIDKVNNRKYQFHFESSQFMDEQDRQIEPMEVLPVVLQDWYNTKSPQVEKRKTVKLTGETVVKFPDFYLRFNYDEGMNPNMIWAAKIEQFIPGMWVGGYKEGLEIGKATSFTRIPELVRLLRERKYPFTYMTDEQYAEYQPFLDDANPGSIPMRKFREIYDNDLYGDSQFSKAAYAPYYNARTVLRVMVPEEHAGSLGITDPKPYQPIMATLRKENPGAFQAAEGPGSVFVTTSYVKEVACSKPFLSFFPKMSEETLKQYMHMVGNDE